jgi:hypothetical protein
MLLAELDFPFEINGLSQFPFQLQAQYEKSMKSCFFVHTDAYGRFPRMLSSQPT